MTKLTWTLLFLPLVVGCDYPSVIPAKNSNLATRQEMVLMELAEISSQLRGIKRELSMHRPEPKPIPVECKGGKCSGYFFIDTQEVPGCGS